MVRKVEVVPYDPAWPGAADTAMAELWAAMGGGATVVYHIGSTAVPGLAAKPTLDFLVVVADLADLVPRVEALRALGYESRGEAGVPGRRYFRRLEGEAHTDHVHAYAVGDPAIACHLAFRDTLRAHPEAVEAYAALKRRLAAQYAHDSAGYTDAKSEFVADILRQADLNQSRPARRSRASPLSPYPLSRYVAAGRRAGVTAP